MPFRLFFLIQIALCSLAADFCDLQRDLEVVRCVDEELADRFPVTYSHLFQGGYFVMPSARMSDEGEIGFGVASLPPYTVYNARVQLFDHLEITANYRVFCGILDPVFGNLGFGDFSDKGANIKWALLRPEDSDFLLPGLAVGWDDFMGTQAFQSSYLVLTEVVPRIGLEATIGYGFKRINHLFGGLLWMPFRKFKGTFFRDLAVAIEYDATRYKEDPHPDGREEKSAFNYGLKWRIWNLIDFQVSSLRGKEWAVSGSASYNFGYTSGFVPKVKDPLPISAACVVRPEEILVEEIREALMQQGFSLLHATLEENRTLRLSIYNCRYLFECEVRRRLNALLAAFIPETIDWVIVEMESLGFPIQEYHFAVSLLNCYRDNRMGDEELMLLSERRDVTFRSRLAWTLFHDSRSLYCIELLPKVVTFFGSTTGKFKYAAGVSLGSTGFLPGDIFYEARLGYLAVSKLGQLSGVDFLNPSQLPNVNTDIVLFYAEKTITIDQLYLQKALHLKGALFGRASVGYYVQNWAGAALELLYYPARSPLAIGVEAAVLKPRTVTGLGLSNKIRKYEGFYPTEVSFLGTQFFLDLYYEAKEWQMDYKVSVGQFVAKDIGVSFLATRYFPSGLRLFAWYTPTNGHDKVNGTTYYDKGVGISMPLDLFYTCSSRRRWDFSMSAWLRDVGYRAPTGFGLYPLIHDQRQ